MWGRRATRRSWMALGLLGALLTPARAGNQPFVLISKDQEVQIGKESAQAVEKEFGFYRDLPGLNAYVKAIGQKLVAQCGRKDIEYHFQVLDTPVINAFALPGGYIYVTRGILARMNSEDELATVLGHELAHVALRHGAQEMSRQTVAQLGLQTLSILKPGMTQNLGQYAGAALNLAFLGYSRDMEAQADDYGITYAEAAGYNPRGATKMFQMFKAIEQGEPGKMEKFLASHPPTGERLAYADGRVGKFTQEHPKRADRPLLRDEFLRRIDGLTLGGGRGEELVQGGVFVHKGLRFSIDFPDTYEANLSPGDPDALAVFFRDIKAGSGQARRRLIGVEGKTMQQARPAEEFARNYLANLKVPHKVVGDAPLSAAGAKTPGKVVDVTTNSGTLRLLMAFVVRDRTALVLYGSAAPQDFQGARPEFEGALRTLRFLSERELASYQPAHMRLIQARAGDTWGALASREMKEPASAARLAAFNGVFNPARQPEPGMLVKIADRATIRAKG